MHIDRLKMMHEALLNWFSNNDTLRKMLHVMDNCMSGNLQTDFLDHSVFFKLEDTDGTSMFTGNSNGILKEPPSNLRVTEAARCTGISNQDAVSFVKLVYLTSYLESISDIVDQSSKSKKQKFEQVCLNKLDLLKHIFDAKDEMARVITSDVDSIASGFRMIYQTTIDDNLDRFDIYFDKEKVISNKEKMELGLRLMEKGNLMQTQYKGQYKTFETSTKKRIAMYFPRPDDNISDNKYSYPRVAVHTIVEGNVC